MKKLLCLMFLVFSVNVYAQPVKGVNSYSNLTVAELQTLTKGTPMAGTEQVILEVEKQYQINAFFILAVANQETSMGRAGVGASRNNLFGMRGSNGFYWYDTPAESIRAFGACIYRVYWRNGRKTLPKIAEWYCDSSWAIEVEKNIDYLYRRLEI